jgi:hypothetical protein
VPGLLGGLPAPTGRPKRRDRRHEGMISLVIGAVDLESDSQKKAHKLPALYLGSSPIFADRSIEAVCKRLNQLVESVVRSQDRATYCLHPIQFDHRFGLYGRDLYNRSVYRRRLERLGVTFSADPYPRLTKRANFECDDWGEIAPEVVMLAADDLDNPQRVVRTEGALLTFSFLTMRFGQVNPSEMELMTYIGRKVTAVSAQDPAAVMSYLRADHLG